MTGDDRGSRDTAGRRSSGEGDGDGRTDAADRGAVPETDLELVAIAAVADNGVIGVDGEMPWHISADLRRFKRLTTDHPVILGRVTYESVLEALGEPFPDRTSIVLTSRDLETPENAIVAHDVDGAVRAAERAAVDRHGGVGRAYVAGGSTVYEQFLPAIDRLHITEVHREPDGDATFPEWDRDEWSEVSRDERDRFAFVEYERSA